VAYEAAVADSLDRRPLVTRRRIPFADAIALFVVAHHRGGIEFPTRLAVQDDTHSRIRLDFGSIEDLQQWLPFFGNPELSRYEQPRTYEGSDELHQDVNVVWRGWSVDLSARGTRPAGPLSPLAVEVASIIDAIELPAESDAEFEDAHESAGKIDRARPLEGFRQRVTAGDVTLSRHVFIVGRQFTVYESYSRSGEYSNCAADGGDLPAGEHGTTKIGKYANLAEARQQLAELRIAIPDADIIDEFMLTMPHWWFNQQVGGAVYLAMVDTAGGVHYVGTNGWQRIGRVDLAQDDPESCARILLCDTLGAPTSAEPDSTEPWQVPGDSPVQRFFAGLAADAAAQL